MSDEHAPEIPEEFLDPEGTGEAQDPDLAADESELETATSTLRRLWAQWMCRKGEGRFADVTFFGKKIGGVPEPAVDAYRALESALRSTGYSPASRWAYNCRKIANTNSYSLHSAGIAIDIDPVLNPYSLGHKYSGALKAHHVEAVLAIKNQRGESVWSWGGNWSKPDRMHFQLDQGPLRVDVDGSTVPGGHSAEEGNMLKKGSGGQAVTEFQNRLLAWDPECLPRWGADGDYGDETAAAVRRFQEELGLDPNGMIDGVTASLLPTPPLL
jgi:peptidoglycan hydrolase-like protein with peptidoglycan-binding domain